MFLSKVLMLRYTPGTNRRLLRFLIEFAHCHRNLAKLTPISIVAGSNRKCNIETTQKEDCTMHIASFKWCVGDYNVVWKSVAGFHFLYFEHTSYPVFSHPRNIYSCHSKYSQERNCWVTVIDLLLSVVATRPL